MDECKSLFSAFMSGVIHIVMGHPFDTIKTMQQSNQVQLQYSNLYRGLIYPVMQNATINSITFGSNHYFKKHHHPYVSYMYCGVISTIISTPLDEFKILRQYNIPYTITLRNTIHTFKSTHVVGMREMPATFLYFATYDYTRQMELPIYVCGALAGLCCALLTHPIDTIKTRVQGRECSSITEAYTKGGLYNGIPISLARTTIVNAVNFSVYEYLMRVL